MTNRYLEKIAAKRKPGDFQTPSERAEASERKWFNSPESVEGKPDAFHKAKAQAKAVGDLRANRFAEAAKLRGVKNGVKVKAGLGVAAGLAAYGAYRKAKE